MLMYFCLVISILSTLMWINVMYAEYITSKVNPYSNGNETEDKMRSKLKTILVIIMSTFWSSVILYW